MTAKSKLIFDMFPEEKKWFQDLVSEAGKHVPVKSNISLLRFLADTFAKQIGFRPRPGSEEEK